MAKLRNPLLHHAPIVHHAPIAGISTHEIPAFGAAVGAPLAPIWETAAFGGGESKDK